LRETTRAHKEPAVIGQRDTPDLLPLFKEQLTNETASLVTSHELDNPGQGLIWWYFLKLAGLTPAEVEDIVCDGANDLGIDAIHIDSGSVVNFYQFKHPATIDSIVPTSEIDKLISGLTLIINRQHTTLANPALKAKIDEIYKAVPSGYVIHVVTSGAGVDHSATIKLDSFVDSLNRPTGDSFSFTVESLKDLHERHYTKNLPTISDAITFKLERTTPYMARFSQHDSYSFHLPGSALASLYDKYGEQLLQQNIRGFEGDQDTNRAIYATCTGENAGNFYHYNNGVAFLCEEARWDQFSGVISPDRAQVVNGAQTLRVLNRAMRDTVLRDEPQSPYVSSGKGR
jgi:hypothetical protein